VTGRAKRKGARVASQAPLPYINVNRTSLDHLLLGVDADVNECVACVLVQFEFPGPLHKRSKFKLNQ